MQLYLTDPLISIKYGRLTNSKVGKENYIQTNYYKGNWEHRIGCFKRSYYIMGFSTVRSTTSNLLYKPFVYIALNA